eukprot:TRINITY_DN20822_c0_g1_i1.p1 TRINITY_DN20822_c0_g1~~TRINITY_DN20822_c0_g1_i1.p1  ORF type:complete len:571 (+),score=134.99 TRINITY_DN20822_c0_g1_i1:61-1773(+)
MLGFIKMGIWDTLRQLTTLAVGAGLGFTYAAWTVRRRKRSSQLIVPIGAHAGGSGDSLGWLNTAVETLWPKIDEYFQSLMHKTVTPKIQGKLPSLVADTFRFSKCSLGTSPPAFGPISMERKPCGLHLRLGVTLDSKADIEISCCGAKLGARSVMFHGELHVQLGPILEEAPFIGGVVAYFLQQPTFDIDFTGAGDIADVPGIAELVRDMIDSVIASALVMPNVFSKALGTPEQGVNPALLAKPHAAGVLRAAPLRAEGLVGADTWVFSQATSDPYVKVTLGDKDWTSSVVSQTCNPAWSDADVSAFVIYDKEQTLKVEVFDQDMVTSDDFLGALKPISIADALTASLTYLPLLNTDDDLKDQLFAKRGKLQMRFDWLDFLPTGELGEDGCVVAIEVHGLRLPAFGHTTTLRVQLDDKVRQASAVTAVEPVPATPDDAIRAVVQRCKQQKLSTEMTANVTGTTKEAVEAMLVEWESSHAMPGVAVLVNYVFYIPLLAVTKSQLESKTMDLCFLDAKGKEDVAKYSIALGDILKSPELRLYDGDDGAWVTFQPLPKMMARVNASIRGLKMS